MAWWNKVGFMVEHNTFYGWLYRWVDLFAFIQYKKQRVEQDPIYWLRNILAVYTSVLVGFDQVWCFCG